jgi:hypothetical protein
MHLLVLKLSSKERADLFLAVLAVFILTIKRWRMQDSVAILLG